MIRGIRIVLHEKIAFHQRGKMSKKTGHNYTNRQTRNLQDFQHRDILLNYMILESPSHINRFVAKKKGQKYDLQMGTVGYF